jgi:hypothetical protein
MTVPAMAVEVSGATQLQQEGEEGGMIGIDALPHARTTGGPGMLQNWIRDKHSTRSTTVSARGTSFPIMRCFAQLVPKAFTTRAN